MQLLLNYNYDKIKTFCNPVWKPDVDIFCSFVNVHLYTLFTYMIILLVLIDDQLHEIQRKTFCFECLGTCIYMVGPSTLSDNYI